jgi:hypothetical protein
MKYVLPLLLLLFLACNADKDVVVEGIDHQIIGKWELEATKISPGGIVDWTNVTKGPIFEFKSDSTFELSKSELCPKAVLGTFHISEDILHLEYFCDSNSSNTDYYYWFEDGKLILGLMGCIEECSYRYKPVN